jgi:hypothetical protein
METKRILTKGVQLGAGAVLAAALLYPKAAEAADLFYRFDHVFGGQSTPPAGPGPWLNATFHDSAPGTVLLTITNVGLSQREFIGSVYFNLNPADDVNRLTFALASSSGAFDRPKIFLGENRFKAAGDGRYDILFSFETDVSERFSAGESVTYRITGISSLVAADFNYLSLPAGGVGPFFAAAHIQGTHPNICGSAWVAPPLALVPEPAAGTLLGLAAGLWCARRCRRLTG